MFLYTNVYKDENKEEEKKKDVIVSIDGTGPDFWRPRPVPVWKIQTGPDRPVYRSDRSNGDQPVYRSDRSNGDQPVYR